MTKYFQNTSIKDVNIKEINSIEQETGINFLNYF